MKINVRSKRRAISPIIATVLIIAVTLIAAVAIGGFVFGLFGASSNTAQVQAVNLTISHATTVGALASTCSTVSGTGAFIQLQNTGSANTVVTSLSLTYGGNTYSNTPSGTCTAPAGSSVYLQITAINVTPSAGQQFTGFAVTSNGAQVVFAGAFT